MYCKHNRLAASCEDCLFVAALEHGQPMAVAAAAATGVDDRAPVNVAPEQELDVVEQDTHVMRPDLDQDLGTEGNYTLIRAGDPVPANLAGYPRWPGSYTGPASKARTAASGAGAKP